MLDQDFRRTNSKHHGQRWRVAFTAIRFTRFLVYLLSMKILENHSLAIEVLHDDDHDDDDAPAEVHVCMPLINIDQKTLIDVVQEKSTELLNRLGGPKQVAALLGSQEKEGLPAGEDELEHRRQFFGGNGRKEKQQPIKRVVTLFLDSLKEKTLIIFLVCAVMSLVFGINQHGRKDGCSDGASNIVAVLLVAFVSSMTKLDLSNQFQKVAHEMSDIKVQVLRGGRHIFVSIFDIVVGDVVCLKIGDQVPADGLLLNGYSLKVDESGLRSGDGSQIVEVNSSRNPFLLSGSKVINGYGSMLVTSVGMNTSWGKMMSSRNDELFLDEQQTPIQAYLNKLTSGISKAGLATAMVVSMVLWFNHEEKNIGEMVKAIVGFINIAVTIVALAIPEGLPLAATLTLAYSMKQMMKNNTMVLKLASCETMATATTICTDITGSLTLNQVEVKEVWLGEEAIEDNNASKEIAPEVFVLLQEGIALNTTATVDKQLSPISTTNFSGFPIEKAILSWSVLDMGMDVNEAKENCEIIGIAIHPETKRSGVLLMRKSNGNELHTHWKGDAGIILAMCSSYYDKTGAENEMDEEAKLQFEAIIQSIAAKGLNCIAFAHKRVIESNGIVSENLEETGLSLLALVGMKDTLQQGIGTEIESCKNAEVNVKIVTGGNIYAASAIAIECGILAPKHDIEENDESVLEGVQFRNYSLEERMERVDNIRVMAGSSPSDKLLMVQCLKAKGHVVAVTGGGTDDTSAFKEADIGLFMGTREGIQVTKETSDILILDGNFTSVLIVLRWARCVYKNIQKFIQFQLTVNIAAFVFNFIAAISSKEIPLTSIQLLWVNLIVDVLGVLAFSTNQTTEDLISRPPVTRRQPLISYIIWKKVLVQAVFQVFILLAVQFKSRSVFGWDKKLKNTIIFNIFALSQLFSVFNARASLVKNMFRIKGLLENKLIFVVIATAMLVQMLIVEFSNKIANTKKLEWKQWCACIVIAALSWVTGRIIK